MPDTCDGPNFCCDTLSWKRPEALALTCMIYDIPEAYLDQGVNA